MASAIFPPGCKTPTPWPDGSGLWHGFSLGVIPVLPFVLLYLNFRRLTETLIVILSVPFGLVGGMVSSTVLTLRVIPALYALVKQWQLRRALAGSEGQAGRRVKRGK